MIVPVQPRAALWIVVASSTIAACDLVFGVPPPGDGDLSGEVAIVVPDIVAHYRFDSPGPVITDDSGRHDGESLDGVTSTPGVIGSAIAFPAGMPLPHVVVPNSSAWDLPEGAIELWVRPVAAAAGEQIGILSRDNMGTSDGHFALVQYGTQFFVIRMQSSVDADVGVSRVLCSEQTLTPGTWMHLGINLGPPAAELWVDGTRGTRTDAIVIFGEGAACNSAEARSILGNDDPWVFGALNVASAPGTTTRLSHPFVEGAIDELVIWNKRQDFSVQRR